MRGAQQLCTILHSRKLFYTEIELEGGDSTISKLCGPVNNASVHSFIIHSLFLERTR